MRRGLPSKANDMPIDDTLIAETVHRVLSVAQPDKIILFGSAATGTMTKDSDVGYRGQAPFSAPVPASFMVSTRGSAIPYQRLHRDRTTA